ncbi:mechanosensitive ion channel family protein [Rurimicrobium arvi]|uniref:Mechanosensitive ion channel family protein n=1 Tax=Rurimicrobium arvi TaxID=2049916 RepID=A0ABP8MX74_9BACT
MKDTTTRQAAAFHIDQVYDRAYDWLILYTPRFILGLLVLIVGLWLVKIVLRLLQQKMHKRDVADTAKPFLLNMAGVVLRVLVVLGAVQTLGFKMTLFTTIVGAFGVAAGLALSGTLQNFTSGIMILLLKPFVTGDNIVTQGVEGTVSSIQIFYTVIITFDKRTVIVPNSKLSNEVIINISKAGNRRLDIELAFPATMDFKEVRAVLEQTIDNCKSALSVPKKRIGVSAIEGDTYKVAVNVWVNAHGFQDTKLQIQECLLSAVKQLKNKPQQS